MKCAHDVNETHHLHSRFCLFSFLQAAATILSTNLPATLEAFGGLFEEVQPNGALAYGEPVPADVQGQASLLVQLKDDAELDTKELADAFADVANAMLVSLSDRCVEILDNKAKLPSAEAEAASVSAVTALADFALSAASVFGQALPGVVIENGGIKYNGKARKNKLETLFYNFMKAGAGVESIKAALNSIKETGGQEDGVQEDEMKRVARMGCLQHIFSISEGKHKGFETRLMNDRMMRGEGGMGGMADLAGMFQSAAGGAGAGMDEEMMREMMSAAGGGAGGMPGGAGVPPGLLPEEFTEQLREFGRQVDRGVLGRDEVKDLEKQLGIDLSTIANMIKMVKTMGAGGDDAADLDEMVKLLEKLEKLKK